MESIYKLSERACDIAERYDAVQTALENLMEETGGEVTEESDAMMAELEELKALSAQIKEDFIKFPDEYAAWFKNVEAEKKLAEAEMKAFEELQKKALAKYKSKVKKLESRMEWIRQNLADAMAAGLITGFDKKSRPNAMFSIFFKTSNSIEVDEKAALKDYQAIIAKANESCPEWLSFEPKIAKGVLSKADVLPEGFERKTSKSLQIQ